MCNAVLCACAMPTPAFFPHAQAIPIPLAWFLALGPPHLFFPLAVPTQPCAKRCKIWIRELPRVKCGALADRKHDANIHRSGGNPFFAKQRSKIPHTQSIKYILKQGVKKRCLESFLGTATVARHSRDISKIAGICRDIVCSSSSTLCGAIGVSARVSRWVARGQKINHGSSALLWLHRSIAKPGLASLLYNEWVKQ